MPKKLQLINPDGQANFGLFPQGIEHINYLDFDLRNAMDKPCGKLAKKFKFNQFQFISITCDELVIGLAIVDLKIASNCFVYAYNLKTEQLDEHSFVNLFSKNTLIEPQPNSGNSYFKKGDNSVYVNTTDRPGERKVTVKISTTLILDAIINESDNYLPLSVCARAGYTGFHFTQKSAALNCSGTLLLKNTRYDFSHMNALACVDWSAGYMRRETFWNWASLACKLPDGRYLGLNLSAGVIETGFTENAIWLDGKLYKIDMVDFKFNRYGNEIDCDKWELHSNDGLINLTFEPVSQRFDKTNLLIVATNFTQKIGRYFGQITLPNEVITLNGQWGLAEDHYSKW